MKFSPIVASALLLFLPAIVSAAPTLPSTDLANAGPLQLFTREATCNPPRPTATGDEEKDKAAQKRYDDLKKKMADETAAYHAGESSCPKDGLQQFDKSKDSSAGGVRAKLKTKCTDGYQQCVTNRKAAANHCKQLGGDVDWGHSNAMKVCQDMLKKWKAKKV